MTWKTFMDHRSFRFKVIFASIVCIILPVIITLTIYNRLTQNVMEDQAISNAKKELDITDEYVTKLLKDMLVVTNFIQIDTVINSILQDRADDSNEEIASPSYEQFLADKTIMTTIENITLVGERSHVTILLKNGKYYTNYPISDYNPVNMFEESWFQELNIVTGYDSVWIGNQPTIFESQKVNNPYQISVVRALQNGKSETYGYVIVTIFENQINQIFQTRAAEEEIMLLDADHQILSHSDTNRIGEYFSHIQTNGGGRVNISGTEYLLTTKELSVGNWKLVSLIPYKQAVKQMNTIFNRIFLLQLLAFTIFLILLAYLISRMTKPIVHLGRIVSQVQAGNLTIRSQIQTKDEIGRFSKMFDQMLDRVNEMIRKTAVIEQRKRKAELAMLQAQINPHFLFNVLNSIRMKVYRNGDQESAKMISSLSKMLRMTIDHHADTITLREEVHILEDYVSLMNLRKGGDITLQTNIADDLLQHKIPRFILQPIIENAIMHGFDHHLGTIYVKAFSEAEQIIICVTDNGKGMTQAELETLRNKIRLISSVTETEKTKEMGSHFSGFGLTNVYERMALTFGPKFQMKIDSTQHKGTRVTFILPRNNQKMIL